ncbi:MAG: DUF4396 domain-containing protein [Pseudomonadota bacterium]
MSPEEIRDVALASLALALSSAAIIALDLAGGKKQEAPVMNLVWPLTALYAGPFAVIAYFWFGGASRASRNMVRSRPSLFPKPPHWQQTVLSAAQAGAGSVLAGLLLGAAQFHWGAVHRSLGDWYALATVAAFFLGLALQYFAVRSKRRLSPRERLWLAFKGDALGMLVFQMGACAWLCVSAKALFDSEPDANDLVFWFTMQLGMLVGLALTYPVHWVLVRQGIKRPI